MMPQSLTGAHSAPQPINQFQDTMINVVYNVCSIVTMPVEMFLRPHYGSRYFPPVIMFFSAVMMIMLPVVFSFAGAVGNFIPFAQVQASSGLIGMWGLSRLFFLSGLIHGVRTWQRMLHMEREPISVWEGPSLPFFNWLPGASFWRVRIVYEPVFLFLLSIALPNFFILENGASNFLIFSAIFSAMKNYAAWYTQWQFIRELMDMKFAGPIIAALAENRASEEDLSKVHLASLPKDLSDDDRRATANAYRARVLG